MTKESVIKLMDAIQEDLNNSSTESLARETTNPPKIKSEFLWVLIFLIFLFLVK